MGDELERLDDDFYCAHGEARLGPGIHFPVRASIIRLSSGNLAIYNPVSFSEEQKKQIARLGDVEAILAPNAFHHLFLDEALEAFSGAQAFGVTGLEKKKPKTPFEMMIEDELPACLAEDFTHVRIRGAPTLEELVLCHRPSKRLLVADYFFNIQETRGWMTPWVLRATGSHKKATQSRLWKFATKDREAMQRSAAQVRRLSFEEIVVCHGETIAEGPAFAEKALSWLQS